MKKTDATNARNPGPLTSPSPDPVPVAFESRAELWWQRRLLPFMVGMLAVLTVFFCIASLLQVQHLNSRIEQPPTFDLQPANAALDNIQAEGTLHEKLEAARWRMLAGLEAHALQRRYHQANVLVMSRIWTRYIGFLTGMILALVGATFILGKLREPTTQLDAQSEVWKFTLSTASPGIVLAVLGTLLMLTTLVVHTDIEVNDRPLYFAPVVAAAIADTATTPPREFIDDSMLRESMKKQLTESGRE